MTLVLTTNVVGQRRGAPVRLPDRRRRLSTIVARHRPPAGRPFVVSVHRRGEPSEIYQPNDRTVRLRAAWSKTLVGPKDVVVITAAPLGSGAASIGLAIASIALIALAPYAAPLIAGSAIFGAGAGAAAGGLTIAIQAGLVIGGVALGYAAQASKASGNKKGPESYGITGGGNLPKPGARKPLLYGRCWSAPPLSQPDFINIDGDATVLVKRMTLGLGRFQVHRIRVGEALFWDEGTGIQAPFSAATGPFGAAIEILYEQPSTLAPGDIITSPSVGGQELPRPGGNPSRTPWFRLAPQGVSVDAAQMNWTYPAIYRLNKEGKEKGTSAGVVFFGREIDPNTGAVIGPEFELWRSVEPSPAYIKTPLRRVAYFRLPKSGAYEVSAQNAYPEAPSNETQENRVVWDAMAAFEDDTRVRPQTTEIALRMRAGKGLTVNAYSDVTVEATRIVPVWTGNAWVEQPTRKAVWAYCDLVRAEYGLDAPSGADADKALHYATLLSANDTYDGQLPEVASFWEAASEVLQPLRADPVKVGAIHSFVRDESRAEPRHILTRRQIVRDSAGVTYKATVEGGDVIVEFDRDGDPKRPDEARYSYGTPSRTPKRYRVKGITNGTHALKHATWLAAVAVFRGAERKVTTEWDGRLVYPGDHILSDIWYLNATQVYGVEARAGNLLTLDVDADVQATWGYGAIRTRSGREWGILRMRGVGTRGLELQADDVAALEHKTGLGLAEVLARDTQDPTTVVLGELMELQKTFVARAAIPSDADHVQIEMVADDPRVWQLLDEDVIVPAPINATNLAEPLTPSIAVLHARCVRIETGIEVAWGVSTTRGARNYEADLSYDGGRTREVLSPFGPESSGRAPMRQVEGPVTVRARAYGRTGLPGAWRAVTFTTVAPVVDGSQTEIINLPPIDYAGLTAEVQGKLDHILKVEADAQAAALLAKADFNAALARAEDVRGYAQGISVVAQDALAKAVQSLRNDDANQASIVRETQDRLTADEATTRVLDGAISRIGASEAAIVSEGQTRATADSATAHRIDGLSATVAANTAAIVDEQRVRADADAVEVARTTALIAQTNSDRAYFLEEQRARIDADGVQTSRITALSAQTDSDRAYVLTEQRARITRDEAFASDISAIGVRFDTNEAAALSETRARADADSAQVVRIDGLSARVGTNEASISQEAYTRSDAISTQAKRTDALIVQTDKDRAFIFTENNARITQTEAVARSVSALVAQTDKDRAFIYTENNARIDQSNVIASSVSALTAQTNNDRAYFSAENTARINQDVALASSVSDLYARSDRGTATGRFSMEVQSGPAGVSARIQALVAVQSYGQTRGAGWYVELLDDGSSRTVFDTNAFYITANGQSTPAFSFDGNTLTIPSLRVTQQLIAPNATSDKIVVGGQLDMDLSSSSGWQEVPGVGFYVDSDTSPGWGVIWTATTDLTVTATGTTKEYRSVVLETAVALNGNLYNGSASNSVAIGAGGGAGGVGNGPNTKRTGFIGSTAMEVFGPGRTRVSLFYRFAADSGCTGKINFGQIKALVQKR
jgi:hypothetical protein